MQIVVLVKHVPEPTVSWRLTPEFRLDRAAVEGRLSQLDEYAVEQAVRLADGTGAEIVALTMGPPPATDAVRKALAMGAHRGVHVSDPGLAGSDALATSAVLAQALGRLGFDLVLCGMASTDAEMSVVPAMLSARLGVPLVGLAETVAVDAGTVTGRRETDAATEELSAPLPAVVSVTDQSGEPRYPAFKAIMAARRKPVETWSLADLGIDPAQVGAAASATAVLDAAPRPPRAAGTVVVDDGGAAAALADFLAAHNFV